MTTCRHCPYDPGKHHTPPVLLHLVHLLEGIHHAMTVQTTAVHDQIAAAFNELDLEIAAITDDIASLKAAPALAENTELQTALAGIGQRASRLKDLHTTAVSTIAASDPAASTALVGAPVQQPGTTSAGEPAPSTVPAVTGPGATVQLGDDGEPVTGTPGNVQTTAANPLDLNALPTVEGEPSIPTDAAAAPTTEDAGVVATEPPTATRPLYTHDGDSEIDTAVWPRADVVTDDGRPLYTYAADPSETPTADGANGVWHAYTGPTQPATPST